MEDRTQRASYESAADGLKTLSADYLYWSQRLSDSSWQMALAVIAGNWAYYRTADGVMKSCWAMWSLGIIFMYLGIALIGAYLMSELHYCAYYKAEENWARWETRYKRFRRGLIKRDPWPATKLIERIGCATRLLKMLLPISAGVVFVLGTVFVGVSPAAQQNQTRVYQAILNNVIPLEVQNKSTPSQTGRKGQNQFLQSR